MNRCKKLAPMKMKPADPCIATEGDKVMMIRMEQYRVLESGMLKSINGNLLNYLKSFHGDLCHLLGDLTVLGIVDRATSRARELRIFEGVQVAKYVELAFLLGEDFDRVRPWARELLDDHAATNPEERVDQLYERAFDLIAEGAARLRSAELQANGR